MVGGFMVRFLLVKISGSGNTTACFAVFLVFNC